MIHSAQNYASTLCNSPLTDREAKLLLAVGAQVMLHHNIDMNAGLVNGTIDTTEFVRPSHVTVLFHPKNKPWKRS